MFPLSIPPNGPQINSEEKKVNFQAKMMTQRNTRGRAKRGSKGRRKRDKTQGEKKGETKKCWTSRRDVMGEKKKERGRGIRKRRRGGMKGGEWKRGKRTKKEMSDM